MQTNNKYDVKDRMLVQCFYGKGHLNKIKEFSNLSFEEIVNCAVSLGCERDGQTELFPEDKEWLQLNYKKDFSILKERLKAYRYSTIYEVINNIYSNRINKERIKEVKDDFEIERYIGEEEKGGNKVKTKLKKTETLTREEQIKILLENINKSSSYLTKNFNLTSSHVGHINRTRKDILEKRHKAAKENLKEIFSANEEYLDYSAFKIEQLLKKHYKDVYYGSWKDISDIKEMIQATKTNIKEETIILEDSVLNCICTDKIQGRYMNPPQVEKLNFAVVIGNTLLEENLPNKNAATYFVKGVMKAAELRNEPTVDYRIIEIKEVK